MFHVEQWVTGKRERVETVGAFRWGRVSDQANTGKAHRVSAGDTRTLRGWFAFQLTASITFS